MTCVPRACLSSDITAKPVGTEAVAPEFLVRQMRAPVRFTVTVGLLARDGVTTHLELGPGEAPADLLAGCLPSDGAELLVLFSSWRRRGTGGFRAKSTPQYGE